MCQNSLKIIGFKVRNHPLCWFHSAIDVWQGWFSGTIWPTSSAPMIWVFFSHKVSHLSFHLYVIWVLGDKYFRRNCKNLARCLDCFSEEPSWMFCLVWVTKWLEMLILFTPLVRRHTGDVSIKIWEKHIEVWYSKWNLSRDPSALAGQAPKLDCFCNWVLP